MKDGTKLHKDIELFYNNCAPFNQSPEWSQFKAFHEANQQLEPYRTEWMIYDKFFQVAGSIDMVFRNSEGKYEIYDWKRSKEVKQKNSY